MSKSYGTTVVYAVRRWQKRPYAAHTCILKLQVCNATFILLIYTAWRWIIYVAETCSCHLKLCIDRLYLLLSFKFTFGRFSARWLKSFGSGKRPSLSRKYSNKHSNFIKGKKFLEYPFCHTFCKEIFRIGLYFSISNSRLQKSSSFMPEMQTRYMLIFNRLSLKKCYCYFMAKFWIWDGWNIPS